MNSVTLAGKISDIQESHTIERTEEKFLKFTINVARKSGVIDAIPCIASEKNEAMLIEDATVLIKGNYRCRNIKGDDNRYHKQMYVNVITIDNTDVNDINEIVLDGTICSKIEGRKTPKNKYITDFAINVIRNAKKSDAINCIAWGSLADKFTKCTYGDKVKLTGRIQSREYTKQLSDGSIETRIAYEVSVSKLFDEIVES